MKKINIGLFGFGVVGEGIYKVLQNKKQLQTNVKKVAIKDPNKERNAPNELFTTDANTILHDPEIDLVVELIDDADTAFKIVKEAFAQGKSVVSANKKMIAEHHNELIQLSKKHQVSFLYEASVCGSVPIIRNLEEYFDNDLLHSVQGIVNGSTNYILSQMIDQGTDYSLALENAQECGFAESDPTLDVEGIDASYKLSIIALHAFGKKVCSTQIIRKGITSLASFDFQFAKEKQQVIKLIAKCHTNDFGELQSLTVVPTFISKHASLGLTNNEYNGVLVESALADEQFFYGKGAGRYPTSSAVLSDISAYGYGYQYEFKKGSTAFKTSENALGKFFISFQTGRSINRAIFENIEEEFIGKERSFIVGEIAHDVLRESDLLSLKEISVISYN
jgi:homoserine dehydrogenase